MFRVLFVLLVIIVVAFLAAWVMPEGFFKPLLQLTGSTFAMIAVFYRFARSAAMAFTGGFRLDNLNR